jgi:hypothetical protein
MEADHPCEMMANFEQIIEHHIPVTAVKTTNPTLWNFLSKYSYPPPPKNKSVIQTLAHEHMNIIFDMVQFLEGHAFR